MIGSQLYVMAGGGDGGRVFNDVYLLDCETMAWYRPTCKGVPPISRWGHSVCVLPDNKLLVFGGHDGHQMRSDINILQTSKKNFFVRFV